MAGKPTLFLHVGPGKTGTSAIQKWLRDHRAQLREDGYFYPLPEQMGLFEGNASSLAQALLSPGEASDLRSIAAGYAALLEAEGASHLILSAEQLASVSPDNLRSFHAAASEWFDIRIIIAARHPYPWLWSVWGQFVKRRGEWRNFPAFAARAAPTYDVYERFFENFSDVVLLTYADHGLLRHFANALHVDPDRYGVDEAETEIINRSLSYAELQTLLCINQTCRNARVSTRISDYMVTRRPGVAAHVVVDEDVLASVEEICGPAMNALERRSPGCTAWTSRPEGRDNRALTRGNLTLPRDVLAQIVTVVREEEAERLSAEFAARLDVAYPAPPSTRAQSGDVGKTGGWLRARLKRLHGAFGGRAR